MLIESAVNDMTTVVGARTLFELKQINFLVQYTQQCVAEKKAHAVESRARTVNREYRRKLHEVDKIAGTRCAAPRTRSGHCAYSSTIEHSEGGGERYFRNTFGEVQPLVFGHFGELNTRFHELINRTAQCISFLHHREHGWKNARAGVPRAKAGVMRRVSMAVLKSTARHMLRGLEIIVPAAMHTHAMRRARSAAAREADHDEMRYDLRGAGHAGCDGRDDGRG